MSCPRRRLRRRWSKRFGDSDLQTGTALDVDAAGNSIEVRGHRARRIGQLLVSAGDYDAFLVHWAP